MREQLDKFANWFPTRRAFDFISLHLAQDDSALKAELDTGFKIAIIFTAYCLLPIA